MAGKHATDFDRRLGERLRALRDERKLSQREIAAVAEVSTAQLQKFEKGINRISVGMLQAIAQHLKVSPIVFFDPEAAGFDDAIAPEVIATALARSREVVSLLGGECLEAAE